MRDRLPWYLVWRKTVGVTSGWFVTRGPVWAGLVPGRSQEHGPYQTHEGAQAEEVRWRLELGEDKPIPRHLHRRTKHSFVRPEKDFQDELFPPRRHLPIGMG